MTAQDLQGDPLNEGPCPLLRVVVDCLDVSNYAAPAAHGSTEATSAAKERADCFLTGWPDAQGWIFAARAPHAHPDRPIGRST